MKPDTKKSLIDELTSLPNRGFFNETLNKALNRAKRHHKILAVLVVDIDNFKEINALGTAIGDKVLIETSERLIKTLRSEDVLARLNGDEFIVLLSDIAKPKFASAVAQKILKICAEPLLIDSQEIVLTTSIGICIFPNDGNSLEDLLKNVDDALHKAKHNGGNGYQFYTHEMDIEAREYIKLESALRNAIANNELSIDYQPKLHIKKGNISGVEALLRWTHPTLGNVSPATFIPIAEDTGLIIPIGEWMLKEACKTNKAWQAEGYEHLTLAINLSPKQFFHPKIADMINNILKETELSPNYLELEINESTIMHDVELTGEILEKLKQTGAHISIDHFGTGYISISHLKKFPINVLKIDRNFIKGIPNSPNDIAITNGIIALAHNLGIETLAEGVETAEQVEHLSNQDCDMVQGYYLSHPLPAQKIVLQFKKLLDEVLL